MSKFTISSPSLLYPSPSPSIASGSLVDSEYLTANEQPSATSSRTSSPVRPAMIIPPPPPPMTPAAHSIASDRQKWMPPNEPIEFAKRPARPDYLSKKKHVPRPPNAFMLFRSMVINKEIPKIENRQQNVSRIAGEIWNVLDDDIKKAWHDKAVEYQIEHKMKHPDYKFAPSRKAPVKPKEEEEHEGMTTEEYIRHLREKYTGVMGPAVAPARKRKPKARKAKYDDEDFHPAPKRSRARTRREIPEEPVSPSPRPHRPEPTFAPVAPSLPPWRLSHSTPTHMPGSSALDLMLSDEYARMTSATYGPVASSSSISGSHHLVEGSSHRKAGYDNNHATNSMSFGHIPMPSPYNSSPGGYGTFAHNMLGLGELSVPHASFYQPFYGGSTSHLADSPVAPAPTPSEAAESFGGYEFNFTDDLLANIVNAGVPLSASAEGSTSPHNEHAAHLSSTSVSPVAPAAEVFSHPPTPTKSQKNTTPTLTPIATPPTTA